MAASKPEARFVRKLIKPLPSEVYSEGMSGVFSNGVPDRYFEGDTDILWIEFKWIKRLPVRKELVIPDLSALQFSWLSRAYKNNRSCAAVVGHPEGALILLTPQEWEFGISKYKSKSLDEVRKWIVGVVLGETYAKSAGSNS